MERFGASFLIAGVVTFLLGFFLQGVMPILTLRKMHSRARVEEIAQRPCRRSSRSSPRTTRTSSQRYFGEADAGELRRARCASGKRHLHRRGLLALPLAVRAAGVERGPALRAGVDAGASTRT